MPDRPWPRPTTTDVDHDEALADWDRAVTLAAACKAAEEVLAVLPELILEEKRSAGLHWKQIAVETGLPLVTVWNIAHRKREGQLHSLLRVVSWLKVRNQPDPSHGKIDIDIRAAVNGMQPASLGQRTAIENTMQENRDQMNGRSG